MKAHGRGDSIEALRRIWMEGYERGMRDSGVPFVAIKPEDLRRVYEPGSCGNAACPCASAPAAPEQEGGAR